MSKEPLLSSDKQTQKAKTGTPAPKVSSGDKAFDKFVQEALQTVFKPKK